jgi:hypothetical protein
MWTANRNKSSCLFEEQLKVLEGNVSLQYTGRQLNIYDRNVFATCVRICRDNPMPADEDVSNLVKPLSIDIKGFVTLSVYAFCSFMGISYGAASHESILASLNRLDSALVGVKLKTTDGCRVSTRVRLLEVINVSCEDRERPRGSDKISIKLHPALAQLYGQNSWSALPDETFQHNGLKGFLLGYYGTHGSPFPVQLETLQVFSGVKGRLANFRVMLTKALGSLQDASIDESSRVESYVLSKNLTHVVVFMKRWTVMSSMRERVLSELESWSESAAAKKSRVRLVS